LSELGFVGLKDYRINLFITFVTFLTERGEFHHSGGKVEKRKDGKMERWKETCAGFHSLDKK